MARTWVDVQKKTFTGWANNFLKERILKINNIEKDLEDGVLLINLLEIISGKTFIKYTKNPKGRFQKIENNNWAIKFIQNEGLKLVGIGGEDIVDGKLKLILGLIWTLILRYQIQNIEAGDDSTSPKAALLEWVRKRVTPYNVPVNDFDRSWQDGRALTALTDSLRPGILPLAGSSGDAFTDINRAMDVAQEDFNIPKIMDPQDLVSIPDELSVMTYVSYFRDYAADYERKMEEQLKFEEQRRKTRADPSKCRVEGPGIQGGIAQEPALFSIIAYNYYGEPLTSGGETFVVHVVGEDNVKAEVAVTDKKDGTYNVAYMPTIPQTYTVTIKLEETNIKDSPFNVKIEGGDAKHSTAHGPGIEGGNAGKPAPFHIQAKDSKGHNMKHGGDPFEVLITLDGNPVNTEITDSGDGTYNVTYYPDYPGEYVVDVSLRGEQISGSPYNVIVYAGTPGNSYAEGPGLEKGQATYPAKFKIYSVNSDGQRLATGGDPFAVAVEGPVPGAAVEPSVIDNGDGTYDVTYTPDKPGDYTVSVFLFEKQIRDLPKTIHFKPAADASKTEVSGPALHGGQAEEKLHFKIFAKDSEGNPRTDGGDNFSVSIDGPVNVVPQLVDNGDGTYDVNFETKEPGDYTVNVVLDENKQVADLPKTVHIKPAASPHNSYAEGEGLHKVFDNEPARFVIHAVDPKGNHRADGGDVFHVHVEGPHGSVPVTLLDNNDGTYQAEYEPHTVGNYIINITLKDHPIKNAPHHVQVKEGTDHDHSGFGSFSLTVISKDKHQQPKTFGGDRFEVTITGPSKDVQVEAVDNQNGTYTASYTLVGSGKYVVDVKLNGKHMAGSPFKQNIGSVKGKEPQSHTFHARAN